MVHIIEHQQQILEEVTRMYEHTSISDLVPSPPSIAEASTLTEEEALDLLTMWEAVAQAPLGSPEVTPAVRSICQEVDYFVKKNRTLVEARRPLTLTAFSTSVGGHFVKHLRAIATKVII